MPVRPNYKFELPCAPFERSSSVAATATTTSQPHFTTTTISPATSSFVWCGLRLCIPQVLEKGSPSAQLQAASYNSGLSQSDQGELHRRVCRQSFMSDVYSFGIVVWEILSREVRNQEMARRFVLLYGC